MTIYRAMDEDFAEWAFGVNVWTAFMICEKDCFDLFEAWNERHSNLYEIHDDDLIQDSLNVMMKLYKELKVDKKMHKVTEKMKVAEKDIKAGKKKAAVKVLKGAEKKNEKLVKIDKDVRDPLVDKAKKMMKKGC